MAMGGKIVENILNMLNEHSVVTEECLIANNDSDKENMYENVTHEDFLEDIGMITREEYIEEKKRFREMCNEKREKVKQQEMEEIRKIETGAQIWKYIDRERMMRQRCGECIKMEAWDRESVGRYALQYEHKETIEKRVAIDLENRRAVKIYVLNLKDEIETRVSACNPKDLVEAQEPAFQAEIIISEKRRFRSSQNRTVGTHCMEIITCELGEPRGNVSFEISIKEINTPSYKNFESILEQLKDTPKIMSNINGYQNKIDEIMDRTNSLSFSHRITNVREWGLSILQVLGYVALAIITIWGLDKIDTGTRPAPTAPINIYTETPQYTMQDEDHLTFEPRQRSEVRVEGRVTVCMDRVNGIFMTVRNASEGRKAPECLECVGHLESEAMGNACLKKKACE
ncbi:hypothetical protein WN48_03125 [Eufriesea mexicana]|nr:hypothetical protein WN48_03125 [Eufriesea mexicana]